MEDERRLRIATERHASGPVLLLSGDLDPATTPELHSAVEAARTADDDTVTIDLAAVEFIDSAGLRGLVETFQRLEVDEVALILRRPSPIVSRLLEITALDTVLPIEH
jgi:anti-sigma B factor antagonist